MIIGMGEHPSKGIRKGEVVDLESATICVRGALDKAEETSQVAINEVHLAVTGGHIQSLVNRGSVPVQAADNEITAADINQVLDVARAVNLPPDQEMLHSIYQHFSVDDHGWVSNPEGMEGAKLAVDMLVMHGGRARLRNTIKVVRSIPIEVQDVAFSGICSGLATLGPEQKTNGVVVIDLGGGTTDYVAYAGNAMAAAGCIAVGGDHVSNDIALAFNISMRQAEKLKRESGSAIAHPGNDGQRMALPAETGYEGRSINTNSLHTVINARMDETFRMIYDRLAKENILHKIGAGVVLTGGGSRLTEVVTLAERVFGMPCKIGRPRSVSGLAVATEGPEYAAVIGMIMYAVRTAQQHGSGRLSKWFKSLLGIG
jgi:cell division protein FtsA